MTSNLLTKDPSGARFERATQYHPGRAMAAPGKETASPRLKPGTSGRGSLLPLPRTTSDIHTTDVAHTIARGRASQDFFLRSCEEMAWEDSGGDQSMIRAMVQSVGTSRGKKGKLVSCSRHQKLHRRSSARVFGKRNVRELAMRPIPEPQRHGGPLIGLPSKRSRSVRRGRGRGVERRDRCPCCVHRSIGSARRTGRPAPRSRS